jgi:guanine deaminase
MIAIKKASLSLRSYENLAGADLYTTCEPCLACLDTSLLVGIKRIIYAASHTDPETTVFFNAHNYYAEDYAKRHPDEISLVAFSHKNEALELFRLARQKYGF